MAKQPIIRRLSMQAPQGAFLLQSVNTPLTVSQISFILRYEEKHITAPSHPKKVKIMITLKALLVNPQNSDDETIATLQLPEDYSYAQYLEALIASVGKRIAYNYTLAELF